MPTEKFQYCYLNESDGLIWCKHWNGSWAPPFTVSDLESTKQIEIVSNDFDKRKDQA